MGGNSPRLDKSDTASKEVSQGKIHPVLKSKAEDKPDKRKERNGHNVKNRNADKKEKKRKKAEEKKQRKFNAQLLRRKNKNRDKYNNKRGSSKKVKASGENKIPLDQDKISERLALTAENTGTLTQSEAAAPEVITCEAPSKKRRRRSEDQSVERPRKHKKRDSVANPAMDPAGEMDQNLNPAEVSPAVKGLPMPKKDSRSKDKRESIHAMNEDSNEAVDDHAARKERKRLKKERRMEKALDDADTGLQPVNESSSDKLDSSDVKKSKKQKRATLELEQPEAAPQLNNDATKRSREAPLTQAAETITDGRSSIRSSADQWNPDALDGDAIRKNKFLRLLGAGKNNNSEVSGRWNTVPKDLSSSKKVENELVQQFDAGIRMKHDGQGKRRGLGA